MKAAVRPFAKAFNHDYLGSIWFGHWYQWWLILISMMIDTDISDDGYWYQWWLILVLWCGSSQPTVFPKLTMRDTSLGVYLLKRVVLRCCCLCVGYKISWTELTWPLVYNTIASFRADSLHSCHTSFQMMMMRGLMSSDIVLTTGSFFSFSLQMSN